MRVTGGSDKLNLNPVRSVEINCTCAGDSFKGTGFVCWPSRDRVSILSGDILVFVGVRLRFEKSSPRWRIVGRDRRDESLMKLVESNLDSDFVSENESDPIGGS